MSEYKNVAVSNYNDATIISIERPDKLNVINMETLDELDSAISAASKDSSCKIIVIGGSGGRAFCAGADVSYLLGLENDKQIGAFVDRMYTVFHSLETAEKPVIAAIHGYCLGGGCELALACDIRIATSDARFGQPEVHVGIIPGAGGTYRLPAVVGPALAKDMVLTGRMLDADEALRIGLISRIVANSLMDEVREISDRITANSYNAIKEAKKAINATMNFDYSAEKAGFISCFKSPDAKEGIKAFLEHRTPRFQ